MPYASQAQQGYVHAAAARGEGWAQKFASDADASMRRARKKGKPVRLPRRVSKNAKGWLQPLAIGTAGGALANQLPSYEEQRRLRENRKRRKRGVAKALAAPAWPEDGFFNAEAAQQAYDLVMKMDRDTAEMFTTMVVSAALEEDIEANRRTLQKHLDEVVAKRLADLKRATIRVVAKGGDSQEQIAFAQAVAMLEEVAKIKTPYDYGYVFREQDIRRNPQTGQFQTKVKHTQKKPISDKVAASMQIQPHPGQGGKNKFSDEQKAQYQDEYRQLANFLGTVAQSTDTPGNTRINLHFEDQHGNQWTEPASDTRPRPGMLDPRDRTLRGITAYPETLTVGGTAFGLAGAMGGGMTPQRAAQFNAAAAGMGGFAEGWTKDYTTADQNARLYGRMQAGGKYLADIAPAGSKANLAGHFGNFVGQYGPQAEAVIGPPTRRTAYRYRGTEKKPDKQMVREYEVAVRNAQSPEARAAGTAPTWSEQQAGSAEIAAYLQRPHGHEKGGAAPRKGLYNLQLASGNTPPSEGVILDRDGQIVSQAIGYGDDHYLPFNLKNLKGLKGGSYIRNRSVGGLTSEDIYAGLISGAREVTVVSRSGTFTMEFEPDFRGGRRHNDKAMRMTRRYEQILDAVQSEQVERQGIDPQVRQMIVRDVRREADEVGRGVMTSADIQSEVKRRIEEYKSSPEMDDRTMDLIDATVAYQTKDMPEHEANRIRARLLNQVAADKEYKFRLNGAGYADALESLREQFPYYIKTRSAPTKEPERHEIERDLGYVEPGRIRPTAAAAGLFGASAAQQTRFAGQGTKVSAAEANYAKPFTARTRPAEEPKVEEGAEAPKEGEEPKKEGAEVAKPAAPTPAEQAKYADVAVPMQQSLQSHVTLTDPNDPDKKWLDMSADDFRSALSNKDTVARFDAFVEKHGDTLSNTHTDMQPILTAYRQGAGRIGNKPYEAVLSQQWGPKPYAFPGEKAYEAGADDAARFREIKRVGGQRQGVVNLKPLDQMSDEELKQEVLAVTNIRRRLSGLTGEPDWETKKAVFANVNSDSPSLRQVFGGGEESMDAYLETVHRTRALNHGIPAEERGFKETFHPPRTEKNEEAPVADRREELVYFAEHAIELYPEGSTERKALEQLKLDLEMQKDRITTPKALQGVQETNPDAITLIMRGLHENKIPNYRKGQKKEEPKQLPPGRSGPIIT